MDVITELEAIARARRTGQHGLRHHPAGDATGRVRRGDPDPSHCGCGFSFANRARTSGRENPEIVVFGHTHMPFDELRSRIGLSIGSAANPRRHRSSVAILELSGETHAAVDCTAGIRRYRLRLLRSAIRGVTFGAVDGRVSGVPWVKRNQFSHRTQRTFCGWTGGRGQCVHPGGEV